MDARRGIVTAYEALVRGPRNETADAILSAIPPSELATFDEECRKAALTMAKRLGITCDLNLNLLPQGFRADRDCLASTLDTAIEKGFTPERLVMEVTEGEVLGNQDRFTELISIYRGLGMRTAVDDFGSGYSGLNVLADFQPDQIKLDKNLVRGRPSCAPFSRSAAISASNLSPRALRAKTSTFGCSTKAFTSSKATSSRIPPLRPCRWPIFRLAGADVCSGPTLRSASGRDRRW